MRSTTPCWQVLPWPAPACCPCRRRRRPAWEGKDFVRLGRPVPVDAPAGQVEVLEFFSHGCIHCFNFEPMVKAWPGMKAGLHVAFRRVPVFAEPLQRLLRARGHGQSEAAYDKLFALFFTEQVRLAGNKPEAVADCGLPGGVDRVRFLEAYQSFGVAGKVRRASQLADLCPGRGHAGGRHRGPLPGAGPGRAHPAHRQRAIAEAQGLILFAR